MKKKYLIILFFTSFITFSQPPNIQWQNRIGGGDFDSSYCSLQTSDGGYVIGGASISNSSGDKTENSKGRFDYWIVKTNNFGEVLWNKTIGGGSPNFIEDDIFRIIIETSDNGFLLGGHSDSPISADKTIAPYNESNDFWIVKTNSSGTIEWQKTFGGNFNEELYSITKSNDGGYFVGGTSNSDISGNKNENSRGLQDYWVLKLDNMGNIIWQKTIGGSGNDIFRSISKTSDGGILVGGYSNSPISGEKTEDSYGFHDYWIIKLDSNGILQWQKTFGGSNYDYLAKTLVTLDGGYLLLGYSESNISGNKSDFCRGLSDYWILKISSVGNIEWQKTIGGNDQDYLYDATLTSNNGYLVTGSSLSPVSGDKTTVNVGSFDAWLVKLNLFGDVIWQKSIGGNAEDGFNNVIQTADGGIFLSGSTNSNISGNIEEAPIGMSDYWVLKLEPESLSINENNSLSSVQIYPNPTTNSITVNFGTFQETVSVSIINVIGQLISRKTLSQISEQQLQINEPNGIYFLEIENENQQKKVFKIIKN